MDKQRNMTKTSAKWDNPCSKEQELSFACLHKNDYNRDKCETFFINYNQCKEFWGRVKAARRAKGLKPYLPTAEERAKIRDEFLKKKKVMDGK